jgi:carboxypeptidase T
VTAATKVLRRGFAATALVGALAVPGLAASAAPAPEGSAAARSGSGPGGGSADRPLLLRVVDPGVTRVPALEEAGFDVVERRDGADFFVIGGPQTVAELAGRGFVARVEKPIGPPAADLAAKGVDRSSPFRRAYPTFYGGYRTTRAHLTHLADVAKAQPALTRSVDVGDSWLKKRGEGGHDIMALCITKKAAGDCARKPTAAKPRLLVLTGLHPREIATPEVSWRLIDHLATGYGKDSAVTELLDGTEIWVVPMVNPDGHDVVESGDSSPEMQRKNRNDNGAGCTGTSVGTDLNRNFVFRWGGAGAGTEPCSETFRGSSAGSEPETVAVRSLVKSLFRDRRGPGANDAAPADTTGAVLTYHSFAGLILYPWGHVNADAPNNAGLRALAAGMATFNNYQVGQPGEVLYNASGTTDDDFYGQLGVPAMTTELIGPGRCDGFFPSYSCVDSTFWPQEKKALMWLAGKVPAPYRAATR